MASQLNQPTRSAPASASVRQAAKVKDYVNQQLEKTRKQVKTIDLIAGILTIVAGVTAFLIFVALVDAWIWPLSTFARWVCLVVLIGTCVAFTLLSIVPLFLKQINPDYAAKMIEEAKPSFRNSLMNYVSLRKRPDEIKPAVFDAVSRQAATDLASVPGDATVDQSKLIRLGFVLIALTVFAVGYKMLSPKDPLQTVYRVLAPAGKIAKPAIVKIEDVQPGDTSVFFGEQLEVTATIRGRHNPDEARLIFSTLDGQLTDQSITMTATGMPNQYRGELSMPGGGIQSSLRYRVSVRDGSSPDYEVTVRPNPSIAIESLVLTPPAYTRLAERTLIGVGDIEAIEGTKATVHAVANLPIKIAYIELLNEVIDANQPIGSNIVEDRFKTVSTPIKMQVEGKSAVARFPLTLNSNDRPFASHYRVRFVSTDDDRNSQPNVYPIRVIPDLAPEIRIVNPVQNDVEVPVNGTLAVEVLATDLDFEIKSVGLHIDHKGNKLLDQKLELESEDDNRRVSAGYKLSPAQLGLRVGDRAVFYATAADNRISPSSDLPDPNISQTTNYSITITDRDPEAETQEDTQPDEPKQNQNEPGDQANEESEQSENEPGQDESSAQDQTGQESGENGAGEQGSEGAAGGESGEPGSESQDPGTESQESGDSSADQNDQGGMGQGSEASPKDQTGDQSTGGTGGENPDGGNNQPQPKDQSQTPQGNQQSGNNSPEQSDNPDGSGNQQSASDDVPGNEDQGGNSGAGAQAEGDAPESNANNADRSETGGGQSDGQPDGPMEADGGEGAKSDSLTDGAKEKLREDATDGERMKKLQEHFENEEKGGAAEAGNENDSNDSQPDSPPDSEGSNSQTPGQPNGDQTDPRNNPDAGTPNPSDQSTQPNGQPDSRNQSAHADEGDANQSPQNNDQTANPSSSNGQQNGSEGQKPEGPNTDNQSTAEDSNNNDSAREQSDKPGMEDATGKQSQDPGGEETNKTGNESGGTDPGDNQNAGDESGKTGQPGEPGESQSGDTQTSGESTEKSDDPASQPSGQGDQNQPGEQGSQESQSSESGNEGSEQSQGGENSAQGTDGSQQGGKPGQQSGGGNPTPDASATGTGGGMSEAGTDVLEREKTNVEHAKKATDLVLKKLSEQRYDPDPELLEKMNWTKSDMEKFLKRWEDMKRAAELGTQNDKRKYERFLKSLDLRPQGERRTVKQLDETVSGLSEDSAVNRPSAERERDFNSFMRDLNRVGDK